MSLKSRAKSDSTYSFFLYPTFLNLFIPAASLRFTGLCHRQHKIVTFLLQTQSDFNLAKSLGASALPMNVNLAVEVWILFVYRFMDFTIIEALPLQCRRTANHMHVSQETDHFLFIELLKDLQPRLTIFQFPPVFAVILNFRMFPPLFLFCLRTIPRHMPPNTRWWLLSAL